MTLTGNNTYTGLTRVQGGTLAVSGADERIADTSALRVHAGATFELDGITETLGSLSSNPGSIVLSNNAVLKAGADDGQRTYSGVMSGNGSFVKVGTGRQTFTGLNTYSGGTTFENGNLRVAADSALGDSSGALTFNGGTLQLDAAFDLASTRAITMDAGGGTKSLKTHLKPIQTR